MSLDKATKTTQVEFFRWFGFKSHIYNIEAEYFGGVIPYGTKNLPCIVIKDKDSKARKHVV